VNSEALISKRMIDEGHRIQTEICPRFACLPAGYLHVFANLLSFGMLLHCHSQPCGVATHQILILSHMHWHATAGVLTKLDSNHVGTHASAMMDNQMVPF